MGVLRVRFPFCAALIVCALASLASASAAFPQALIDGWDAGSPPAQIALVEGSATLERDGLAQPAITNVPFVAGDRLQTAGGRVELLFADGTALAVDEYSTIELLAPSVIRLTSGRAILIVPRDADAQYAARYQIDTPFTSVTTDGAGTYRADADRAYAWSSGDDFDRWAADRYVQGARARSAQYLPQDLRMYGGTFDQYGAWQYDALYGYVWYPAVAPGWRPYYNGYWSPVQPYGWIWIGVDVWSWPTHHYGRWGFNGGSWFWIPGRTWAPAWVSWGAATDYVSWCPLGFDDRPVFALVTGGLSPSTGWIIVPRTVFSGRDFDVPRYAVEPRRLPQTIPFSLQAQAPVAVPRNGRHDRSIDRGQSPVDSRQPPAASPRTAIDRRPPNGYRPSIQDPGRPATNGSGAPQAVPRGGGYGTPNQPQPVYGRGAGPLDPPNASRNNVIAAPAAPRWRAPAAEPPGPAAIVPPAAERVRVPATPGAVAAPAGPPAAPRWRAPAAEPPRPAAIVPRAAERVRAPSTPGAAVPAGPPPSAPGTAVPRGGAPQQQPQQAPPPPRAPESSGSQGSSERAHSADSRHPR